MGQTINKIIAACDSFKGSLTSPEVAGAVARGVREVFPQCEVVEIPVADGGEGTVEALSGLPGAREVRCTVHDPLMRPLEAVYVTVDGGRTAVIESAAACGLTLLSAAERDPLETTTYGVGEMIRDAVGRGCRHFVIGIGGSATNDGGTGMLSALGYGFADREGRQVAGRGGQLHRIEAIDRSGAMPELAECRFVIACDVDNPFTGPAGASHVFGPQKGAAPRAVEQLERGMVNLARVIGQSTGIDLNKIAGAGAAGGLGGAFCALLGARLTPGVDTVLDAVGFDEALVGADIVITGEGRMDSQTLRGKAPWGVLQRARRRGVPVIGICGSVEDGPALIAGGFTAVFPIVPGVVDLAGAMDRQAAAANVQRTVVNIMRVVKLTRQ